MSLAGFVWSDLLLLSGATQQCSAVLIALGVYNTTKIATLCIFNWLMRIFT